MTKKPTKKAAPSKEGQIELLPEPQPILTPKPKPKDVCGNCKYWRAEKKYCGITLPPFVLQSQDWRKFMTDQFFTCALHEGK